MSNRFLLMQIVINCNLCSRTRCERAKRPRGCPGRQTGTASVWLSRKT